MNILALIGATLVVATPLVWAGIGELIIERTGVLNLGIEGTMVAGAFSGFLVAHVTGSAWLGLLAFDHQPRGQQVGRLVVLAAQVGQQAIPAVRRIAQQKPVQGGVVEAATGQIVPGSLSLGRLAQLMMEPDRGRLVDLAQPVQGLIVLAARRAGGREIDAGLLRQHL